MRAASEQRRFIGIAALADAGSAAVTIAWCGSMTAMPGMPMPGGWAMSMAWMRMPGQGWPAAATTFIGMWAVMMIAMMLPALVPMLMRYRAALRPVHPMQLNPLTLRAAAGYFLVWILAGVMAYPPGVALAELAMRAPAAARAVPIAAGLVTLLAGAWQLSAWKSRQLACCRETIECCRPPAARAGAAWRHGVELGVRCLRCCAPLTAWLFVLGVMDLRAMALVCGAVAIERLSPWGERAARLVGGVMVAAGLLAVLRALE
jgi:predicted metal-binding membrane protein